METELVPGGEGPRAPTPLRTLAIRRHHVLAEEADAYVVFRAGKPESPIERFPLSEEGFVGAEAHFQRLVREERARVLRIALIWTVLGGISVWVVSSVVFGALLPHFAGRGWLGYTAAASLSVSEVSNAIWRSALVVLVMMWLVEARTFPDRRGMRVGLAYLGVAGLVVWVASVLLYAALTAPPGGISGPANVFLISTYAVGVSRAVWTSALAALVLMWLVRSTRLAHRARGPHPGEDHGIMV